MAIASVGSIGTASFGGGSTSIAITTSAIASAGDLVAILATCANAGSGNTNVITSVTDSAGGNTWTKGYEWSDTHQATAIYFSRLTNTVASGGTITVNFSGSVANRRSSSWKYTCSAAIALYGTPQAVSTVGSTSPGSLTVSGLTNSSYLAIRAIQANSAPGTITNTGSYSAIALNSSLFGEFLISTATSFTSNPTTANSIDTCNVFITIGEPPASASTDYLAGMLGMFQWLLATGVGTCLMNLKTLIQRNLQMLEYSTSSFLRMRNFGECTTVLNVKLEFLERKLKLVLMKCGMHYRRQEVAGAL